MVFSFAIFLRNVHVGTIVDAPTLHHTCSLTRLRGLLLWPSAPAPPRLFPAPASPSPSVYGRQLQQPDITMPLHRQVMFEIVDKRKHQRRDFHQKYHVKVCLVTGHDGAGSCGGASG